MPKKGYKQTQEHKRKIGEANKISLKGKHTSPNTEFKKGISHFRGKECSAYIDGRSLKKYFCKCGKEIQLSTALYGKGFCRSCAFDLDRNSNWKDGRSFELYPIEFNNTLKEQIRKRDNYECQNCDMTEEEHLIVLGKVLDVHHIDYNKQNCKKDNLITLCKKCHMKTNHNRDYWYSYFTYFEEK